MSSFLALPRRNPFQTPRWWWWWWWLCSDGVLMRCVCRYPITVAPNWGGRTPGSQTPGVTATLGLNVQMDGGRKMPQNCSKLPLNAATMTIPLLRTKMSTSSGDELNMGHFHCRNRTAPCHRPRHLSLHTTGMSTTLSKEFNEVQLWELGCLLHVCI